MRKLPAGQALFRQGDAAPAFFVLMSGAMTLYRVSTKGHDKTMCLIQSGQSFVESVMVVDEPRYPVHAPAGSPSRIVVIEAATCLEIMQSSFATCRRIVAYMTERIQGALE